MAPNEPSKHGLSCVTTAVPLSTLGAIKLKLAVVVQLLSSVNAKV